MRPVLSATHVSRIGVVQAFRNAKVGRRGPFRGIVVVWPSADAGTDASAPASAKGRRLARVAEDVAQATYRLNQPLLTSRFQLGTQIPKGDIQHVGVLAEIILPDRFHQHL